MAVTISDASESISEHSYKIIIVSKLWMYTLFLSKAGHSNCTG